jgi:hypothetical protein
MKTAEEKPYMNLEMWLQGWRLTSYQKALAIQEWAKIKELIEHQAKEIERLREDATKSTVNWGVKILQKEKEISKKDQLLKEMASLIEHSVELLNGIELEKKIDLNEIKEAFEQTLSKYREL